MTYDQWKTTDPRDGDYDPEDSISEMDLLTEELHQSKEDLKHARETSATRIWELSVALEEALAYFRNRYDIRDGEDGKQLPNEEMRLGTMIDEALYGIRF